MEITPMHAIRILLESCQILVIRRFQHAICSLTTPDEERTPDAEQLMPVTAPSRRVLAGRHGWNGIVKFKDTIDLKA